MTKLYLAGYGAADPDSFFAALAGYQIDLALDVRLVPKGWSPRYTGAAMLDGLQTAGARRARWTKRLGNAGRFDGSGMRLDDPSAIADVVLVLNRGFSVLLVCGCGDATKCHRTMIAGLVQAVSPETEVIDVPTIPPVRRRKNELPASA